MFVVFEGIDGSGKTTLSGRVSDLLEEAGVSVHHARPKGELKSQLAKRIRVLARDPRTLTMSPHTELLLYLSRDCQMIDTVIRPALDKAQVVIADRYVYSPIVLCRARGQVSNEEIDQAVGVVARGVWPDLVVYCDVDIHTSALRKKLDKTVSPKDQEDFGRKGLRGLGLRKAMRDVYLEMAKDEDGWMMVDNVNHSIDENSNKIARRILNLLGVRANLPAPVVTGSVKLKPLPKNSHDAGDARDCFYSYLTRLESAGYARMAIHHARSLDSDEAWQLRENHVNSEPEVVARGLDPLFSERAIEMRRRLVSSAPRQVARSLGARWANDHDEAWKLREQLADVVPVDVAMTLSGLDTPRAWEMRARLAEHKKARGAVLASLRRLDTAKSWELREELGRKKTDWALAKSVAFIDSPDAWKIRKKLLKNAAPWVILSLTGLDCDDAWELRERFFIQATKLIVKSLVGVDSDRAWQMRADAGLWCKESLTTIKGSDDERAWNLRKSLRDTWPGYAAKSIGMTLGESERGAAFLWDIIGAHPVDPEVAHYVVKLIEAAPDADTEDDD